MFFSCGFPLSSQCSHIRCIQNEYVHCREVGCIGLCIHDDQEITWGPGDFHRAKSTGNLKVGGRYNLIHLNSRKCTVILSLLIHPWGCIRKYIRVGQSALTVLKVLILTLSIQIAPLGRISCMRQAAFNRLCDNRPRWNTFLQENLIYIYLLL